MVSLPSKGGKSYEQLAAGMREAPSFALAEKVIQQDFKVKLPDRRYIRLWNTPEISQFRGYQEDLDEAEEGRAQHARERMEIQQEARESGASAPDMGVVHQMLTHQRQQQDAMQAHVEDLNRIQREHMEGMRVEQQAELERLAAAQQVAANRAAMAEQALLHLRDVNLEHRNMINEMASRTGVVHQNFDQRQTVVNNNQFVDENVHNRALALMDSHRAEFGEYMRQHQLSAERMQQLLFRYLSQQQQGPTIHFIPQPQPYPVPVPQPQPYPVPVPFPQGGGGPPQDIVQYTGGGPPPAPPGGGMIAARTKPLPSRRERRFLPYHGGAPPPQPPGPSPEVPQVLKPDPIPVLGIPPGVTHHRMDTPTPRPKAKAQPRRRPPSRPPVQAPWRSGDENPAPLPTPGPKGPKRASEEEATEAPVAPKPKAQPKSRARSVSIAPTVLYPEDMGAPAQGRTRARSASVASTIPYDENGNPMKKRRGRPPKQPAAPAESAAPAADTQETKRRKTAPLNTKVLAIAARFPRTRAKAKAAPKKVDTLAVPESALPDKKPKVRKVAITTSGEVTGTFVKRGRGRPKGSKNKKTLEHERWLEEESARLDLVEL